MNLVINLDKDFEFKLSSHTWQVKFVDMNTGLFSEEFQYGLCNVEKQTILINKSLADSMKLSTLLHEMIHAIENLYTVKISHKDLNIIGDALSQVLMDSFSVKVKDNISRGYYE